MAAPRELFREYWAHRPMDLAAALSYYTLLSLAPLVLITVAVASVLFERAAVEGKIVSEIRDLIGDSGAEVVHTILRNANNPQQDAFSALVGLALLLVGATTVFAQLQQSLNRIWHVDTSAPVSAIWSLLRDRLLSLAMVLAIGFLLLVSLLVSAGLSAVTDSSRGTLGDGTVTFHVVRILVSVSFTALLFALIFKVLPDAPVAWRHVWFGAAATSILFTLGKYVIGLYLGRTGIGSAYGAAGSLVVVVVWVYYTAMIMFFGATLACRHSRGRGSR